jgi:hypothetical protein
MSRTVCRLAASCALALTLQVSPLAAQSAAPETPAPGWARVSFFGNASVNTPADGSGASTLNELITTAAVQSPTYEGDGTEYGADLRLANYPSSANRANTVSIYDVYLTRRMASGRLAVKAGQMWLNELGSLGSVAGVLVEGRQLKDTDGSRWRAGVFTGLEPEILRAGYASGVRKAGGYVAFDGAGAQRDVIGLVTIKNESLTERSVLMTNNFLPLGKRVFVFQSAEYDLIGPAGNGSGSLSYFFTNARVTPTDRVDLQATYHRGRSIDVRTISIDTLNGRPIDQRAVEGLLFESIGGRVTITVAKSVRLFGGYARDQTNQDAVITGRATFGAYLSNIGSTGLDLTVSDARILRNGLSSYDSWYVSTGHTVGARAYLSADYTTSLSTIDLSSASVAQIQTNPRTQRFSGSATVNLNKTFSLLVTADHTIDPSYTENRVLAGITCRVPLK